LKPASFDYHAPATTAEAVALLASHGDEAKVLAGGQSLVPMLNLRLAHFRHLVDLNGIEELVGVERLDGNVRIGAMTRQAAIEVSEEVATGVPLLHRATPLIGHFQIRNRGTIGGSIAHADPASEYPAVAIALDATMEITGPSGARQLPAAEFFVATWMTNLAEDEVLSAISFPVWGRRSGFAIEEVARRHGDFAIAGVSAGVELDGDGNIRRGAIGLFGVGSTPVRGRGGEASLVGSGAEEVDLAEVGAAVAANLDPTDDIHASGAYRRRVAAVLVRRALTKAIKEARDV
jgi:carbon-monoxide dehydrogenase medium subunit